MRRIRRRMRTKRSSGHRAETKERRVVIKMIIKQLSNVQSHDNIRLIYGLAPANDVHSVGVRVVIDVILVVVVVVIVIVIVVIISTIV